MKKVLLNASVTVNGVDLSDHATKATITSTRDLVESTAFGAQAKQNLLGLGDANIAVEFAQDFDPASVDATLWPLHRGQTSFSVVVKPEAGAVSPSNPSYTLDAVLPEYTPLDAGVGDLSKVSVTFQNAGQAGITKATS